MTDACCACTCGRSAMRCVRMPGSTPSPATRLATGCAHCGHRGAARRPSAQPGWRGLHRHSPQPRAVAPGRPAPHTAQARVRVRAVGSTALAVLRMQLQPPPQASLLLHRGHGVREHQAQRTVLPDGRAYLSCDHARPTPRPDLPDADACGGEGSYSAGEPE
jgi:hypothetical protein